MSRRKRPGPGICGVLSVDKPAGMTSHDVVDRVRRIVGQRSVGHTGTLDPAARGLLVLCLGGATRFARYLSGSDKTYRAVLRFGRTTNSFDSDGEVTATYDGDVAAVLTERNVRAALEKFSGEFSQMPPAFCAKKVDGTPAYELARRGIEPELKAVDVRVGRMSLIGIEPPDVELELTCSAGFYVRALARDLGEELGTGAYLESLHRTGVGTLELGGAVTLESLAGLEKEEISKMARDGLAGALAFMPAVRLDNAGIEEIFFGRQVELTGANAVSEGQPSGTGVSTVRITDGGGGFLGVGELDPLRGSSDLLLPRRLLIEAFPEELRNRLAR